MTRILLTGASGYVGGQALHSLASDPTTSHAKLTCLARDLNKAQPIVSAYPNVSISLCKGDLDSLDLLTKLAADSDIVLHLASTNHLPSTKALTAGLSASHPARSGQPGTLIQMSGASLFTIPEVHAKKFGEASTTVHDDVGDIDGIIATIQANPTREVDNFIISQSPAEVRTALIIGPLFYGAGQGRLNQRSIQIPEIAKVTLQRRKGFVLEKGENAWSNIHIHDLGLFFVTLVKATQDGKSGALWNQEGIYCIETGIMTFGDICRQVAREAKAQGLIESEECESVDAGLVDGMSASASTLWGTNTRIKSRRADEMLGWRPSGPRLEDMISDVVRTEAQRLATKC